MGGAIYYIVMIVSFAIMLWANNKSRSKGVAWGRPVAAVFGLLAVLFAGLAIYQRATGPQREAERIRAREEVYRDIGFSRLGEYLAANFEGRTLLIIRRESGTQPAADPAIKALKSGLGDRLTLTIESITINDEMGMAEPGAGMMFTNEAWEEILARTVPGYRPLKDGKYEDAAVAGDPRDVVVLSLLGLPFDSPAAFGLWERAEEDRPYLVLANVSLYGIRQRVEDGYVAAILASNPDADHSPDLKIPESRQAAFDQRYVLIYDVNVAEIAAKHPEIFGSEP
jgi:hypothetical protein